MILSTAYLPPISYYAARLGAAEVVIEQHENYQKQSYRNRAHICSPQGLLPLSIPVEKPANGSMAIREMLLSEHGDWRHRHWNALVSAYNSTPFFEYYADDFAPFYHERRYRYLWDYNEALRAKIDLFIGVSLPYSLSAEYHKADADVLDVRLVMQPKRDHLITSQLAAHPYYQVFAGKLGFVPNLSIVDLLFNCGPEAILTLRRLSKALLPR